jgi:hypothetical protein
VVLSTLPMALVALSEYGLSRAIDVILMVIGVHVVEVSKAPYYYILLYGIRRVHGRATWRRAYTTRRAHVRGRWGQVVMRPSTMPPNPLQPLSFRWSNRFPSPCLLCVSPCC